MAKLFTLVNRNLFLLFASVRRDRLGLLRSLCVLVATSTISVFGLPGGTMTPTRTILILLPLWRSRSVMGSGGTTGSGSIIPVGLPALSSPWGKNSLA